MVRLTGNGAAEPRYMSPAAPQPQPEQGKAKPAMEPDSFKDHAGDVLDNASVAAKVLRMANQFGAADTVVGKLSRGLDLATDLPKGVAGQVRNIAGAEPKAPVGMRGSLTERKEGFKAKKGADGKVKLTRASNFSYKAQKLVDRIPGVKQTQKAIGDFNTRIENSSYAAKNRTKAGEVSQKYFQKAADLGQRASAETGAKKALTKFSGKTAKTAGQLALKSAGRFAPGANIAIAGVDWYTAVKTMNDPKASDWKKGAKMATAVFSTVAATNVPVVSQVGAGLSLVTDLAANVSPSKAVEGAKNLAKGAGDVAVKGLKKAKDFIGGL